MHTSTTTNTDHTFASLAYDHYENFPVASRLIAPKHRSAIHAIYAFARTADDFADEPTYAGRRLQELARWRSMLDEAVKGCPQTPLFKALARIMQSYQLPASLFHDLLDAFEQDVEQSQYQSWDEIADYASRSANPIGRLYLLIHGFDDPQMNAYADMICTALQFANFWQDVSVDLEKQRVYIPVDNMFVHDYTIAQLYERDENQAFRALIKDLVLQTQALFDQGKALLPMLSGRLQKEIAMTVLGGEMILQKIHDMDYAVLSKRPVLRWHNRLYMFCRAWMGYVS